MKTPPLSDEKDGPLRYMGKGRTTTVEGGISMRRLTALFLALFLCALPNKLLAEGSWGQINQPLSQGPEWMQIVENTAFPWAGDMEPVEIGGISINRVGYGQYPCIDGSTVSVPMAMEFARQHLGLTDTDLQSFVFFSTTHGAYEHLIHKTSNGGAQLSTQGKMMDWERPVDLIIATEPSDEELALAEAQGVTLVKEPLCYDAFVFIVHKDNPVNNLSLEQIQAIYGGDITNWREVGGDDSPIIPYQREKNSGSQTAMENLVMGGKPLAGAKPIELISTMSGLMRRIGTYETSGQSLGYSYLYYVDTLYRDENVKVLSVDGIAPTPENLRSGAYPFTTSYYGVIRGGEEQATGGLFLDWMLSPEGQRSIAQAGYIPLRLEK